MKKENGRAVQNIILNLFFFPGLGTLRSGRRWSGMGQIFAVLTGSVLILIWLFTILSQYYSLMFSDTKPASTNVMWYGISGGVLFVAAWAWASISSVFIFIEYTRTKPAPPPLAPPPLTPAPTAYVRAVKLDESQILDGLGRLPQWSRRDQVISRTYEFADFLEAMKFVNAVAEIAETTQHHPDIDIRWNKVTLALTTHDAGGLTDKDFTLARQCDELAAPLRKA